MRVRHLSVWMLLVCIVSACASGRPAPTDAASHETSADTAKPDGKTAEPTAPAMQSSHVAMLSNAFAAKRIGAFNYQVTSIVYEVEPGSRLWTLHYVLGPAPDGSQPDPAEFDVLVDDRNGQPRFADGE